MWGKPLWIITIWTKFISNNTIWKWKIYDCFEPINTQVFCDNAIYIIDGGFLIHPVVWQKNDTFNIVIINILIVYWTIFIHSWWLLDNRKNIKAMEQLRRTAAVSTSCEVHFNESMKVPINLEKFLSSRFNKRKLI